MGFGELKQVEGVWMGEEHPPVAYEWKREVSISSITYLLQYLNPIWIIFQE